MKSVWALAARAAASATTLLITGETGVGKGRLARWIHDQGPRSAGPFVPVNCGAIPDGLFDSQLFGHARGSFSGATGDHLGLVRAANGGTLLLDEVGELPPAAQVRLLRLLEEREVQPVGYARPVQVEIRIIAASNGDLRRSIERGDFREDLFFRLDVLQLHVPPLRRRTDEILRLLDEFNLEFARQYRRQPLEFGPRAREAIRHHAWPGNVRQLRTTVERLHILCDGQRVDLRTLELIGRLRASATLRSNVGPCTTALRRQVALDALRAANGNVSIAAAALGVHRSTVYRWLADPTAPV